MNEATEEIKKRIDIIEFLSQFITLKRTGRNFKALCPFHQEKTPSFVVSAERQIWRCFGSCNEGGDVVKFLMKWENLTFFEALKELAEKTGVKLKSVSFDDQAWKKKERIISMNQLASEFFSHILHKTEIGQKARDYLKSRGVKRETAKKFMLGYAPNSWDSLLKFLKKKRFTEAELYEAGLITRGRTGFFDMFRGRLIFPIKDSRGNIIGFSGRVLNETVKESKYVNTPETPVYHKRESLYGIDLAKETMKEKDNVILVEGEFDVILPYQAGIKNIIATKGTAITRDQLTLLKRFIQRITLALDSDSAGEEAVKKALEEAQWLDLDIEVIMIDWAKDPADAVVQDFIKFKKTINKPIPAYDFIFEVAKKRYDSTTPFGKKQISDEILPYIERIQNPIIQSHYIKKAADFLGVSEKSIESALRKLRTKKKVDATKVSLKKKEDEKREQNIQKYILSVIFQNKEPYNIVDSVLDIIVPNDFSIPSYTKLIQHLSDFRKSNPKSFDLDRFVDFIPKELQSVVDDVYLYATAELGFENENLERLSCETKRYSLKRQITELLNRNTENEEDKKLLRELGIKLKEVEKKTTAL